jgi:HAD superfamily hydrolase (TIGR01662 family)
MREIVAVLGYNASGKSTLVKEFTDAGYHRINRDEMGGTIEAQAEHTRAALNSGHDQVVLDNTYPTIASRASLIQVGKDLGVPVRAVWLQTSFEDAQLNACLRQIDQTGHIIMPDDFKGRGPNLFPPVALFTYKNKVENKGKKDKKTGETKYPAGVKGKQDPTTAEGFSEVEKRPFVRVWPKDYTNKALILDADDTVRRSTGKEPWPLEPSEIEIIDGCADVIKEYEANGYLLLGVSNQSTHEKKEYKTPLATLDACFERTNELLGVEIEWHYCPHYRFPVACFCRKPHSGLGAVLIRKHKLNPSECIYVGDSTSDKTFAGRCGFQYQDESNFFKEG